MLLGYQMVAMIQDCLGRKQRPNLAQQVLAQLASGLCQPALLGLVQDESLVAELLAQNAVFRP